LVETNYAVKGAKNNGVTPCNNKFFNDPLPGISKQCYCDADNYYGKKEIKIDLAEFAAKKAEEEALQQ
jgi:membrane protein involved in colicin uptake